MEMDTGAAAEPPFVSRQHSAEFNKTVSNFMIQVTNAFPAQEPVGQMHEEEPAATLAAATATTGGADNDGDNGEEDDDGEEEDEETEEQALERAAALTKKKFAFAASARALKVVVSPKSLEPLVNLEHKLAAEKITDFAMLKSALELKDGDTLTVKMVKEMLTSRARDAYDAEHGAVGSQEEYDPFAKEECDDDDDDPAHYGKTDKPIYEMSKKDVETLLVEEKAELKTMVAELAAKPKNRVMDDFAATVTPDKEEEAKATLNKVSIALALTPTLTKS